MSAPSSTALGGLPREWWFPDIPNYRDTGGNATYERFDLDPQPHVPQGVDVANLLADKPPFHEWTLVGEDASPVRRLNLAALKSVADGLPVPTALLTLAAQPDLQRRVRSNTGCYLDLGDFSESVDGTSGRLLHFLSDQQWCRHWMLYLDGEVEVVVTTVEPYGFDPPDDWPPPARPVRLSSGSDVAVCADSFEEFVVRFWIENELAFDPRAAREPVIRRYADALRLGESA